MTHITNIDDSELRELLIKNLPPKIKGGDLKDNSNIFNYPTIQALNERKFINFNTKEQISFMVFDIDTYEDKTALEYFKNINNFLSYLYELIGYEPTFITQTQKGFHFAYHLKNHIFTHQKKALNYLKSVKEAITKLTKSDVKASNRLNGVWRNPLKHTHYYSKQINYELNDFKDLLPEKKVYKKTLSKRVLYSSVKDIKVGNRNSGLFMCGMRYAKYQEHTTPNDIFDYLHNLNEKIEVPLNDDEILKISNSVFRYWDTNKINENFGVIPFKEKEFDEGVMKFEKMSNLTKEEYIQETKRRQSLSAQRTLEIRDKDKNKEQLKKVREEYLQTKKFDDEKLIKETIEFFKSNDMKINVSQISKHCKIDRRSVKKIFEENLKKELI